MIDDSLGVEVHDVSSDSFLYLPICALLFLIFNLISNKCTTRVPVIAARASAVLYCTLGSKARALLHFAASRPLHAARRRGSSRAARAVAILNAAGQQSEMPATAMPCQTGRPERYYHLRSLTSISMRTDSKRNEARRTRNLSLANVSNTCPGRPAKYSHLANLKARSMSETKRSPASHRRFTMYVSAV